MIIYDLCCINDHRFEGWFKSADDFQSQQQQSLLNCPVCGSVQVSKLPSASYVHTRNAGRSEPREEAKAVAAPSAAPQGSPATAELLQKLQDYLDKHSENVGGQFSEEAKKMHYGESEKRSIHGHANVNELQELHEEGIPVMPLPALPTDKKKLN